MKGLHASNHSSKYRPLQCIAEKTETDPTKRVMEERLLTEEEAKLKQISKSDEKRAYYVLEPFAPHLRQCVGAMSMRFLVDASTQSTPFLRTGNTSACGPLWSITQTSRSASAGAIETSHHLAGNACISPIDDRSHATRAPALI